jgi:hypothetical protein
MPFTYARHLRRNGVTVPVVLRLILLGTVTAIVGGLVELFFRSF